MAAETRGPGTDSWRARWVNWRNRLIANPAFQRWAVRFPLTRPIARSQASRLFDLVAGFVYSQVLSAAVSLNLFEILSESPQPATALAARWGLPDSGAERLLKAAAALDLVELLPDGRYALGMQGAGLIGNPGIAPMIAHHRLLYADLADPVALLAEKTGGRCLAEFWDYREGDAASGPYSALMAASQPIVAREILDAYPFGRHRRLLDIGGGQGAFLAAVGQRHQQLELALFDLPGVAARAQAALASQGMAGRTTITGGDFRRDPLPRGADLLSLVRVLHDHDDGPAMAILTNARAAQSPGDTLLVAEPMAGARGAARMGDAYFGFYLAAMGQGRPRKPNEIIAMLKAAGYRSAWMKATRMPLLVQVVAARV